MQVRIEREQLGTYEFKFKILGLEKFYLKRFYAENIYHYILLAILLFISEMIKWMGEFSEDEWPEDIQIY